MNRFLSFATITLFAFFGCTEDKTEMVLNIYSDLSIPFEMDRIELRLLRTETEIFSKEYKIESKNEMPVKILLTQENNVEELIGIKVKAKKGNNLVEEIFVERAFVRYQRVTVDIYLKKGGSKDDVGFDIVERDYFDDVDNIDDIADIGDIIDGGTDVSFDISDDIGEVDGEIGCSFGCGQNTICIDGKCKCVTGFENCDNDWRTGCEADIINDVKYCGGCNASCNVLNVENVKCNIGKCDYDACKVGYEDADKDRTNGCEKFNFFPKVYGGSGDEKIEDMEVTSDGGLIVVATTSTCCFGDNDIWIFKTDKNGDVLWQRVIGGNKEEKSPIKIYEMPSGDLFVIGSTLSFNPSESSGLLAKLDKNGNLLASRVLSGSEWSGFKDIICDKELNCTILGSAGVMGDTGPDLYELIIDKDINIIRQRLFRIKNDEGDDTYIVKGGFNYNYVFTSKDNTNKYSMMILMLGTNNSIYSAKELYGEKGVRTTNCIQVSSDGMYCTGYTDGTAPSKSDILVFQYLYSNKGSIGWQKVIGDIDLDFASISDASNDFSLLLAGTSIIDGLYRATFINMDNAGSLRHLRSFQSKNGEGALYLNRIDNNLFLMGGVSFSHGFGGMDLLLIPVNIKGENIFECHLDKEKAINLNIQDANFSLRDVTIDEILNTNFVLEDVNLSISDKMIYEARSVCAK